jgi:hypothetical protein
MVPLSPVIDDDHDAIGDGPRWPYYIGAVVSKVGTLSNN